MKTMLMNDYSVRKLMHDRADEEAGGSGLQG